MIRRPSRERQREGARVPGGCPSAGLRPGWRACGAGWAPRGRRSSGTRGMRRRSGRRRCWSPRKGWRCASGACSPPARLSQCRAATLPPHPPAAAAAPARAAAASAATAAEATTPFAGGRTRLVHADRAAVQRLPVQLLDRLAALGARRHLDEAEAAGAAGVAVGDDAGGLHGARLLEEGTQTVISSVEGETSDVKLHCQGVPPLASPPRGGGCLPVANRPASDVGRGAVRGSGATLNYSGFGRRREARAALRERAGAASSAPTRPNLLCAPRTRPA